MGIDQSHLPGSRDRDGFTVVGVGASAGGLEACQRLISALPPNCGLAVIVVQHLDPDHDSHMADLLAAHTSMTIRQASDGMPIEPDHIYLIAPGTYLSVALGALRVSPPEAPHGARLPVDFLFHSLSVEYGANVVAVVLSGTGADGSLGLKSVKESGGLVIAQDPKEAAYDGMPRSAIATGAVDFILPVEKIPETILNYRRQMADEPRTDDMSPGPIAEHWEREIIDLLRTKTDHDFTLYKPGTLHRRIERRMAIAAIPRDNKESYFKVLQNNAAEREQLAKDLLINVTCFFRDRDVFDWLEKNIVPDMVRGHEDFQPLRVWCVGCSSGEEAYSLAMLFQERIAAENRDIKLQVFASDVDPDALATAREGLYPATIAQDVSPQRLSRFFSKEEQGYKVVPALRTTVVFSEHDILVNPPFSRMDLVSCRNLLIYLRPDAQAKTIGLLHFALREGGYLVLGHAETAGATADHLEIVAGPERIYRRIGQKRLADFGVLGAAGKHLKIEPRPPQAQVALRASAYSDLFEKSMIETYAPAGVLINDKHECLYYSGPIDNYLRVPSGSANLDLFAMARQGIRAKLNSAIRRSSQENARIVVHGGRTIHDGVESAFSISAQPISFEGDQLTLICFLDEAKREGRKPETPEEISRSTELELELESVNAELQALIRDFKQKSQEQETAIEEALSINEEFQSTNEELLTSKEELQSMNEELAALNTQLEETLKLQRKTSNDLNNVLNSTNVATLFLNKDLSIQFFTPATRRHFGILPTDVGRPLADLSSLAADGALMDDAHSVLSSLDPLEREIETRTGTWFSRRILPYRDARNEVEGVVITYTDITAQKRAIEAMQDAERAARAANVTKSRFLAAASHDLRQPLQTLSFIQGLLVRSIPPGEAQSLVEKLGDTVSSMSRMLNTLLDINQIEAGTVHAKVVDFPVNELLDRMKTEFAYHAKAQKLDLHVVPCRLSIRSDQRLLEQIIRNLLMNAFKYTKRGKILLGCRRHGRSVSIEVIDTGIGIPEEQFKSIFEEYHQLDNTEHETGRGLGLGLSIVKRLSDFLSHPVRVRSKLGRGSAFTIEVPPALEEPALQLPPGLGSRTDENGKASVRSGMVLVIEDNSDLSQLLERILKLEGYDVATAQDGDSALDLLKRERRPDLILADYNLAVGMNGLQVALKIQETSKLQIPVVILTGDISTRTLRDISSRKFVKLSKPVNIDELTRTVHSLLPVSSSNFNSLPEGTVQAADSSIVFVVDDDPELRKWMRLALEHDGWVVKDFATSESFLESYRPSPAACLVVDCYLPGMNGIELLQRLHETGQRLPAIMITGNGDVPMAVQAMKAGALDFLEKPVPLEELLGSVERALDRSGNSGALNAWRSSASSRFARLTSRQRQILSMVLAGYPSKNIAADLRISQRTVENHRAAIMRKTGSKSIPELARLALAAAWDGDKDVANSLPAPVSGRP